MPKCPNWPEHLPLNEGAIKVKPSKTKTNLEILKIEKSPKKKIQENRQCGSVEFFKVENNFLHIPRGLLVFIKGQEATFFFGPKFYEMFKCASLAFFFKKEKCSLFFLFVFQWKKGPIIDQTHLDR